MKTTIIKAPKSWKGAESLVVDYIEDNEIYQDGTGINLESVEIIPFFEQKNAKFFISEFKAIGSHYRISILEHLSEAASDEIKALLIAQLKAEASEAELDKEVENYR
jgi:hypothetical protein